MKYILLKSKVGPVEFDHRPMLQTEFGIDYGKYSKFVFRDDDGSDCRSLVPESIWEELSEVHFNRKDNIKYKDVFIPLQGVII